MTNELQNKVEYVMSEVKRIVNAQYVKAREITYTYEIEFEILIENTDEPFYIIIDENTFIKSFHVASTHIIDELKDKFCEKLFYKEGVKNGK